MSRENKASTEEKQLDNTLRPQSFKDYVGQPKTKENLQIILEAAKKRNEPIEHVLLHGGAGLGKSTLAHIIAKEMGGNLKVTSGPVIEKVGDLASVLTNLEEGDILFFDECHRLNKSIEEVLYPAMEDFLLDIIIGKGPSAKTLRLDLPKFTLIAATTKVGTLSSPLRSRFGMTFRLDPYSENEIGEIIKRSARILGVSIEDKAVEMVARRSRFTPRIANHLLKRIRDYAQVKADGKINQNLAKKSLQMMEIDHLGLEPTDRTLLETVIKKFDGGPVGIQAMAAATNEDANTIEEVYEPYLLRLGFINRTPRGRTITSAAYKHLNISGPEGQEGML
jgi:Holliday junction DNA helicase RuvB